MKKGKLIFILFLVVFIVAGVCISIIVLKNRAVDDVPLTQTIYIGTNDALTGEKVKANFAIVINNTIQAEGTTNLKGVEEVIIPIIKGENIYVLGFSDKYYVQMGLFLNSPFTLDLYKRGEIELTQVLTDTDKVNFTVKAINGQYRQLGFCIGWSMSFLEAYNAEYLQGEYMHTKEICENYGLTWNKINDTHSECSLEYVNVFPSRLKNTADRCYYTMKTLAENESMSINVNYDTIQELGIYDELEITFFDSDRNYLNKYSVEREDGSDVGSEDYTYILSSECIKNNNTCNLQRYQEDYY